MMLNLHDFLACLFFQEGFYGAGEASMMRVLLDQRFLSRPELQP